MTIHARATVHRLGRPNGAIEKERRRQRRCVSRSERRESRLGSFLSQSHNSHALIIQKAKCASTKKETIVTEKMKPTSQAS